MQVTPMVITRPGTQKNFKKGRIGLGPSITFKAMRGEVLLAGLLYHGSIKS